MKKKTIAVLCAICAMLSFSGCTINDHQVFFSGGAGFSNVFRIGNYKCPEKEAMLYLATYQNLYGTVGDVSLWNGGFETDTIFDSLKKSVVSHLTRVYALDIYADENEVTLSNQEKSLVEKAANDYYSNLSKSDKKALKVSKKDIEEMYLRYALAEKVYFDLMNQVDNEVSEDEARVMDAYVLYTTKEDTANYVQQSLDYGLEFMSLLGMYGTGEKGLRSIARGTMPQEVEDVIFNMEDEEVSDCISTGDGYYFVYCINKYNAELSEANKANVIEKRKAQVISDIITNQNENYYSELNESLLDKMEIDTDIETMNFFSTLDSYISF